MPRLQRRLISLAPTILSFPHLDAVFALPFTGVVDLRRFPSLGLGSHFGPRLLYRYVVMVGFTLLSFLVLLVNLGKATQFSGRGSVGEAKPASGLRRGCQVLEFFC
ncbi:MAG: hypothetical protein WHT07_04060 [Desulfobaccales bacterium]